MPHSFTAIALLQMAAAYAAPPTVSAPLLGFGLSGGALTRYMGIPGACYSTPDADTTQYQLLRTPSGTIGALLVPASGQPRLVYRAENSTLTVPLPDDPSQVAISPSAAYFAAASATQLLVFDRTGVLRGSTQLASMAITAADITELAVADQGDTLVATATTFWYAPKPGAAFIAVPLALSHVNFAPRDHLLVAYDTAAARIIAIHPTSAFAVEPLITSHDAPLAPTALHFSADGTAVWLNDPTLGLVRYDLPTPQSTPFPIAAGTLGPTIAPGVFAWSGSDAGAAVLDTTQPSPTVFLVPARPVQQ